MTFVIIGCFCSVIFIPLGIALMWFYSDWKKKTKFILSFSTGFLYLFLMKETRITQEILNYYFLLQGY